jgi:molecular chaperone DnaK
MSKEEIDKAVKDAEKFAEEDKKAREAVEARNGAEQLCFQIEKSLEEVGDKLTEDEKNEIKAEIEKTREALKGTDTAAINDAKAALEKKFYEYAAKLYQQPAGAEGAAPEGAVNPDVTVNTGFSDEQK